MRIERATGRRRVAALATAAGLLWAVLAAPGTSDAAPVRVSQDVPGGGTSLKAEYDEIIGQEAALITRVDEARANQDRLARQLVKVRSELKAKQVELSAAQEALAEAEDKVVSEATARKAAEKKVSVAKERLRRQIVASYVSGGENSQVLDAIVDPENGEDAGNARAYSRAVVGDTDALLRELESARAERRRADKAAKSARAQAARRRDDIADATTLVVAAQDNQARLVQEVNFQVLAENEALKAVRGRKVVVEDQIAAMKRTSDSVTLALAALQSGQPNWKPGDLLITNPIPGYRIGSGFGQRKHPILGTVRLHAGGDLAAPSGTTIFAPADGVVVLAGVQGGYGNATVIDHGFSLTTLYGHQSRIDVNQGQVVKRGDPIGRVGSTGLSTGPHLHFETRLRGVPTDPAGIVNFELPETTYAEEIAEADKIAEAERLIQEDKLLEAAALLDAVPTGN